MKLKNTNENRRNASVGSIFKNTCLACGQRILAQIRTAKEAIFTESFKAFATQERLLRLALNEAEAVAWQTRYPHLVFPTLAAEKVQAVIAWNRHQQTIRRSSPTFGLAV